MKLGKVTELLRLMLGSEASKADANGDVANGDGGGSSGLRACLGVAQDLTREVELFKQQQFTEWEVRNEKVYFVEMCNVNITV
jgi:hypothetical protein